LGVGGICPDRHGGGSDGEREQFGDSAAIFISLNIGRNLGVGLPMGAVRSWHDFAPPKIET
jgi:hypothetical protein